MAHRSTLPPLVPGAEREAELHAAVPNGGVYGGLIAEQDEVAAIVAGMGIAGDIAKIIESFEEGKASDHELSEVDEILLEGAAEHSELLPLPDEFRWHFEQRDEGSATHPRLPAAEAEPPSSSPHADPEFGASVDEAVQQQQAALAAAQQAAAAERLRGQLHELGALGTVATLDDGGIGSAEPQKTLARQAASAGSGQQDIVRSGDRAEANPTRRFLLAPRKVIPLAHNETSGHAGYRCASSFVALSMLDLATCLTWLNRRCSTRRPAASAALKLTAAVEVLSTRARAAEAAWGHSSASLPPWPRDAATRDGKAGEAIRLAVLRAGATQWGEAGRLTALGLVNDAGRAFGLALDLLRALARVCRPPPCVAHATVHSPFRFSLGSADRRVGTSEGY